MAVRLPPSVVATALLALALAAAGCGGAPSSASGPILAPLPEEDPYGSPVRLGVLADTAIGESSGIVASRRNPGLYWTHNDSDKGPFLYLIDRAGASRGRWRVAGARILDWEDIAAGPGPRAGVSYLYVGDIGDNLHRRREIVVYRVEEPAAVDGAPRDARTAQAETIRLRYPDGRHDSEALLVHPRTGDLYVVTKQLVGSAAVYRARAPLEAGATATLEKVATLDVGGLFGAMVTGGDVAPDGRRVALCDYASAYEYELPAGAESFDAVWGAKPLRIRLGGRDQGEAICYRLDGAALLATSEGRRSPIIEVRRRDQ